MSKSHTGQQADPIPTGTETRRNKIVWDKHRRTASPKTKIWGNYWKPMKTTSDDRKSLGVPGDRWCWWWRVAGWRGGRRRLATVVRTGERKTTGEIPPCGKKINGRLRWRHRVARAISHRIWTTVTTNRWCAIFARDRNLGRLTVQTIVEHYFNNKEIFNYCAHTRTYRYRCAMRLT